MEFYMHVVIISKTAYIFRADHKQFLLVLSAHLGGARKQACEARAGGGRGGGEAPGAARARRRAAAGPTCATHCIWTVLKAGETVHETGELPKNSRMHNETT